MPESIQPLFGKMHRVLGLYLSNRCNIACRHCGVESGPWEPDASADDIIPSVAQLAANGLLRGIHVSGGEPFLYPNVLSRIGSIAAEYGLLYAINTNAFWAKDSA